MISMTNQLDIRDFEYFLVLSEIQHYGKAAEKLHITQSALSQKIQRFEAIMGCQLFERTNRQVSLNPAGVQLKKEVELILNQIKVSMERWKLSLDGTTGLIRIGFVGSAMQRFLPPVIKLFSQQYPNIKFILEDLNNRDQLIALEKLMLDVGFIRSDNVPESMMIRSVNKENFALVLPENHPVSAENFVSVNQLANESFILFPNDRSNKYFQLIVSMCEESGFTPRITHRAIDGPTIFKLVESELGVSVVPSSLRDDKNYRVKFIELKDQPQKTELFAVWNKNNENPALKFFLELV